MANHIAKPQASYYPLAQAIMDQPGGYSLFIKAPFPGGMMHRIQQFTTLEEATQACEFFAAHWHESESIFEVWQSGKRLIGYRHKDPDQFETTD